MDETPPATAASEVKRAFDPRSVRVMGLVLGVACLLACGFTFANCTLESLGSRTEPAVRISPPFAWLQTALPIGVVIAGIVFAIRFRARGINFIVPVIFIHCVIAAPILFVVVFSRGPLLDSMHDVETVWGGPGGQGALLRYNGGDCYEVYVFRPYSMVMVKRGKFFGRRDTERIVWRDGEITHNGTPLQNPLGYCKDWL